MGLDEADSQNRRADLAPRIQVGFVPAVLASVPVRAILLRVRHGSNRSPRSSTGQPDGDLASVAMSPLGEGWTRSRGQATNGGVE